MDVFADLTKLALFAVIVVFVLGIGSMAMGKETAEDMARGNKLMRLRVEIQAVALGLILVGLIVAKYWHNLL